MKIPIGVKAFLIAVLVTSIVSIIEEFLNYNRPLYDIYGAAAFWLTLGIAWEYLSKKDKSKKMKGLDK
jgi:hypothetical protein